MSELLAVVIVLAGASGLGWLFLACLTYRRELVEGNVLEIGLLSLTLGVLALGWVALILAEAGQFSLTALIVLWAIGVSALAFSLRRRAIEVRAALAEVSRLEWVALGVWLILACYLFFRPHQSIVGGADAGVYVNLGGSIAGSGGILIHDQTVAELDQALYPALLRECPDGRPAPYYLLPGFYVPGEPAGLVIPQFYPLHPVWLSVFHSLGGLGANLIGTPFWALLGSLAVYLAVRQMFGWRTALLSLAALTVNALQVWFARYPTSEMLTQYLFWIGIYALTAWLSGRQPARLWALVAGLSLGEVFLTRIDMYFLLAIPLLLALWLRWREKRPGGYVWFLVPVLGLAVHSLVHGSVFSWPYFNDLYQYGLLLLSRYLVVPLALALIGIVGLVIVDRKPDWRRWIGQKWPVWRPTVLVVLSVIVVMLAAYGYWIRPRLGGPTEMYAYWYGGGEIPVNLDRENLVRLGWYLSPLGLALAVSGLCLSLWRLSKKTFLFLGSGLFFSMLYLWRIQANPHQIYAMRRYVPVVMPFFIVTAAYFLTWLYERRIRWQKWAGAVLAALWMASLAWLARGFVSQVDYRDVIGQLDGFNARLAPNSVLIFDDQSPLGQGDFLGTPLHFFYGHDVFSLRRPEVLAEGQLERQIEKWQAEGREVYWIGQPESTISLERHELEYQGDYQIAGVVLEGTYETRPWQRVTIQWSGRISRVIG